MTASKQPLTMRVPFTGLAIALALLGCNASQTSDVQTAQMLELSSPAGPGAMAPHISIDREELLLSWLEPGTTSTPDSGHRFLMSRLKADQWSEPVVIAEGEDFFANWADVPKIGVAGDGTLWAHWLAKIGEGTYAYGIFLARSADGGRSWERMGTLHDDETPTEHGFVAYAPEGDELRAIWLDGRGMVNEEPMTLRTAVLGKMIGPSEVLDDRVCECCPPDLTNGLGGPVAFYRDRTADEVRDIGVVRPRDGSWSPPAILSADGWKIPGCPVNGPAIDADADDVAVAWFTGSDKRPRVQLAFSPDGGSTFSEPVTVDDHQPLGRVDLVHGGEDTAWITWLALADKGAEIRLGRFRRDGVSQTRSIASTGAARASGIPRIARIGDELFIAWVATGEDRPTAVRIGRLAIG